MSVSRALRCFWKVQRLPRNRPPHSVLTSTPAVYTRNGTVYASSRDVAAFFGKRHDNVLKAVEDAIATLPTEGLLNFKETTYTRPQNGQTYRMYEVTKDGFVYVTMGFTGKTALAFKVRYIEEFNRMEAQLKMPQAPQLPNFMDPGAILSCC